MEFSATERQLDLLRGLTDAQLNRLQSLVERHAFAAGETLLVEGTQQDRVSLLTRGRIRLDMNVPGRGRTPILTLGAGDLLAFSALLGTGQMTASAVAEVAGEALSFDGSQLRQLCAADHELGYAVMSALAETLARRLVATRLQLLDLFHRPTPAGWAM
jgi:CRP/FNR family cyclic AMP-dependent transcriptional regulator